jgi:alpha-ketoglutarate-dependent taurine dioxygenase
MSVGMSQPKPSNPLSDAELDRIQKALEEQKSLILKAWEKVEDLEGEIQTAKREREKSQEPRIQEQG